VLLRTFVDQVCMCPAGLAVFFTFMTLAEGGGQKAIKRKFRDVRTPLPPLWAELMKGIYSYVEGELLYLAGCTDY